MPEDERETARGKAKRIGFGTLYGSGAGGLAASAWSMYRIDMSAAEAQAWKDRFYDRYPQLDLAGPDRQRGARYRCAAFGRWPAAPG